MKRRVMLMLVASIVMLSGCAKKEAQPSDIPNTEVIEETVQENKEEPVSIGNPWVDCDENSVFDKLGFYMFAPGEAKDVKCQINESDSMAQMTFTYGEPELEYTYRVKKSAEFEDISGLYYEWAVEDEQQIGWCDGECKRAITDEETIDLCQWYDKDMGLTYSLSTSAPDLDGFDILAVVYQLFLPEDESEIFMPANFLEANVEKDVFESFDEIISLLEPGNAYAVVRIYGLDEDVLMITEGTYDNGDGNMASIDASVYRNDNGKVISIGNVFSYGTAYPISLDKDGRIYAGGNHEVNVNVVSEETKAIMTLVLAVESFDENQNVTYSGFVRETNKVYEDGTEIAEDDSSTLEKCFEEYAKAKPVCYTVVE